MVATGIAVEGRSIRSGETVLFADDPVDPGGAVTEACRNEDLCCRLSRGGFANVQQYFSFTAARNALQEFSR